MILNKRTLFELNRRWRGIPIPTKVLLNDRAVSKKILITLMENIFVLAARFDGRFMQKPPLGLLT